MTAPSTQFDTTLLDIFACPACDDRPPLTLNADSSTLDCAECGRRYPIEEGGIPVLLIDHALPPLDK